MNTRNTFDQKLKEVLNQQSLQPSTNAWERVQLARQKNTKKTFPIYRTVVAAIAILMISGLWFMKNDSTSHTLNSVVLVPEIQQPLSPQQQTESVVLVNQNLQTQEANHARPYKSTQAASPLTASKQKNQTLESPYVLQESRSALSTFDENFALNNTVQIVTAQVIENVTPGETLTETDLDVMIDQARKRLKTQQPDYTTDASQLLRSSEQEILQEYRNNVIQNLMQHKRIKIAFGK